MRVIDVLSGCDRMVLALVFGLALLATRVAAAPPGRVQIQGDNILLDGQVHLPFGMVAQCGEDEFARLKVLGINSIHIESLFMLLNADGSARKDIQQLRRKLDEAHQNHQTALVLFDGHYLPSWLFERYPDAHMKKYDGTNGQGGWHPYCLDHPGVRKEIKTFLQNVVGAVKSHPALMSWCLWNEPHLNGGVCYSEYTLANFRKWLKVKYKTLAKLNSAWQSKYQDFGHAEAPPDRSNTYWFERHDFQQAMREGTQKGPPPKDNGLASNPVAWTDWMRFRQENYAAFFKWEADVIRQVAPDLPITTKIVQFDLYPSHAYGAGINSRLWIDSFCDVVGYDCYPHLDETVNIRWKADFMRGMAQGKPIWDTEMGFTWVDVRGRPSPETHVSAFWMQFARGVKGRYFFHWSPGGTFFQRFTYPDGSVEPGLYALQDAFSQVEKHKDLLANATLVPAQVALLHSMSTNLHQCGDYLPGADVSTIAQCLYRKHIPYQYVTEEDVANGILKNFKALITVGVINISDQLLARIEEFTRRGGHVLANTRFAEFDEYGRKRQVYPPHWFGARAAGWHRTNRKQLGTMTLDRTAIDHFKKPVDVKVELASYESRPMHVDKAGGQLGLTEGTVIGSGDLFGSEDFQLPFAARGRHEQIWEDLQALPGAQIIATFDDGAPAMITTERTMYIGRDTCWMNAEFADVIAQFMLHADVQRKAYVRDGAGEEVAPLDIVLTETPTKWVVYATNSPQTLLYDGSPLKGVRVGLPGNSDVIELFSGKTLRSTARGGLREVVLDFQAGEAKILVSDKARPRGITFRNFSGVNMGGSGDASLYGNALSMNRQEILWASCEPTEGDWNQNYLDSYAAAVLERNNNNVETLVLLAYAAPWSASPSPQISIGSHPAYISTEHIADWVNYVDRVVRHLSAPPYNVEYFQIWNEPWKHPDCGFWGGSDDEFFTNVYLPGAAMIRQLGGKVVYGGWPSCEDLSSWVALLDKHQAWDDTDVLSFHYQSGWNSVWAWPRMRGASTSQGFPKMAIWTTEVGAIKSPSWFTDWYSKLFYWAVANGADNDPDMVKAFYFKLNENDPDSYHYHRDLYRNNVITERGLALQAMADVFDGGPVTTYTNFSNDRGLKPDIATFGRGASAVEGFEVHARPRRIVIAFQLLEQDLKDPTADKILLDFPELAKASNVVSVQRIDVAGYATDLNPRHTQRSMKVSMPIANDSASPAQSWNLGKVSPFFVVATLRN